MQTILLDEQLSEHVADALNSLSKKYFPEVEVASTKFAIKLRATDEQIAVYAGKNSAIVMTLDRDFLSKALADLCRQEGASIIFVKPIKGRDTYWEMVKLIIKYWEDVVQNCVSWNKPFSATLSPKGGLKRHPFF